VNDSVCLLPWPDHVPSGLQTNCGSRGGGSFERQPIPAATATKREAATARARLAGFQAKLSKGS
jgi:hypothetical protein